MDNLTHSLTGLALARCGLAQKYGKGTTLLLVLASNLPDIDAVLQFADGLSFLGRRTLTHSLLLLPLLALVMASLAFLINRRIPFRATYLMVLLGAGLHILMDLPNSYGVQILWPLSTHRFELASVFVIDPFVYAILLTPLLASVGLRRWVRAGVWQGALMAMFGYYASAQCLREYSGWILDEQIMRDARAPDSTYIYHEPFGPWRFRGVAQEGNQYTVYEIRPFTGTATQRYQVTTEGLPPMLESRSEDARALMAFFKSPVWLQRKNDAGVNVWRVYDLRFRSLALSWRAPFEYEFPPPDFRAVRVSRAADDSTTTTATR